MVHKFLLEINRMLSLIFKYYFKAFIIMTINKHVHNKKIKATVIVNPASRSGLKVYQKLTNCVDNYFYHEDQIFILIP
jgi:hypothetical protein